MKTIKDYEDMDPKLIDEMLKSKGKPIYHTNKEIATFCFIMSAGFTIPVMFALIFYAVRVLLNY